MRLDHLLSKEESKGLVYCLVVMKQSWKEERKKKTESSERKDNRRLMVAMRIGQTPVPIPNTTVKTYPAEGTALETVWESRWPPVLRAYSAAG